MSESNSRFLIAKRPSGRVERSDFDLVTEDVPDLAEGEALIRVEWISVDPTNRGWLNDTPTYLPVVPIGEVVRAAGLGRCVASRNPAYEEGRLYQGLTGWQQYFVASDAAPLIPVQEIEGVETFGRLHAMFHWRRLERMGRRRRQLKGCSPPLLPPAATTPADAAAARDG